MEFHLSPFDFDPEFLRRILTSALARGGDYADIYFEREQLRRLSWEEGKIRSTALSVETGFGLRVVRGTKTGYAHSNQLGEASFMRAAETASHIAGGDGGGITLPLERRPLPDHYPVTEPLEDIDLTRKIELLQRVHTCAHQGDPRVEKVMAQYIEVSKEILIVNSEGDLCRDLQPMARFSCSIVINDGGHRQTGGHTVGGRVGYEFFTGDRPEELATEALRMARLQLEAVPAPAGAMAVVLGAATGGVLLHEAVGHGLEADFNHKKLSRFTGRVGQKVASELCTVVDDPTIIGDRGAINIDDEGTPVSKTTLIENGILQGYLHDRISARAMGVVPTGNGRRESYRHYPLPRMTNTYLLPGESTLGEIIASVERGIYAKSLGSGQVEIGRGDFVFNINEGYLIENGRVTTPVRNATLIGNGPDVMSRVSMVGDDLEISPGMWTCGKSGQRVPVNQGMPHLKISEITVGGTSTGGNS
jgi:TldD protein